MRNVLGMTGTDFLDESVGLFSVASIRLSEGCHHPKSKAKVESALASFWLICTVQGEHSCNILLGEVPVAGALLVNVSSLYG